MLKAAEQGHLDAQTYLGLMYHEGLGTSQNDTTAMEWLVKSADQGCSTAPYNIGVMYDNGYGVIQDSSEAAKWYQLAAKRGYKPAFHEHARCLYEKNQSLDALPWAEKAVKAFPDDANYIDTLACIYQELGRYKEAFGQFELCLKLQKEKIDTDENIRKTEEKISELKKLMTKEEGV